MKEFYVRMDIRGFIKAETAREAQAAAMDAAERITDNSRPQLRITTRGIVDCTDTSGTFTP